MIKKYHIEKWYPPVISLALTAAIFFSNCFEKKLPDLVSQLTDNAISISVTLIGFLPFVLLEVGRCGIEILRFEELTTFLGMRPENIQFRVQLS